MRWQFGVLVPPGATDDDRRAVRDAHRVPVRTRHGRDAAPAAAVPARAGADRRGRPTATASAPVDRVADRRRRVSRRWDEAVERAGRADVAGRRSAGTGEVVVPFEVPAAAEVETAADGSGRLVRRTCAALAGRDPVSATELDRTVRRRAAAGRRASNTGDARRPDRAIAPDGSAARVPRRAHAARAVRRRVPVADRPAGVGRGPRRPSCVNDAHLAGAGRERARRHDAQRADHPLRLPVDRAGEPAARCSTAPRSTRS